MTVNSFRKSVSDEETSNLAKQLIKTWKKLLGEYWCQSTANEILNFRFCFVDGKSAPKGSTNGSVSPANSEDTNDSTGLKRISSVSSSLSNQEISQDMTVHAVIKWKLTEHEFEPLSLGCNKKTGCNQEKCLTARSSVQNAGHKR